MAEAIMNRKGRENFTAFGAGSHPTGTVRPEAIRQIEKAGLSAADARSKSRDELSNRIRRTSALCSRSATTLQTKSVHSCRGSR